MEKSADELLDGLARCGCLLRMDEAGRLVMDVVPLDMASAVTNHEADLTRILKVEAASMAEAMEKIIDPPDPCPKCGSLELWETLARSWRCQRCDPPTKARRLRERAARLRRVIRPHSFAQEERKCRPMTMRRAFSATAAGNSKPSHPPLRGTTASSLKPNDGDRT